MPLCKQRSDTQQYHRLAHATIHRFKRLRAYIASYVQRRGCQEEEEASMPAGPVANINIAPGVVCTYSYVLKTTHHTGRKYKDCLFFIFMIQRSLYFRPKWYSSTAGLLLCCCCTYIRVRVFDTWYNKFSYFATRMR